MGEKACRVLVAGMVTGVGFRYSTIREASRYPEIQGTVRNVTSRQVECVVQGPAPDVDDVVAWLRHGPSSARVLECKVTEIPVDPRLSGFRVVF